MKKSVMKQRKGMALLFAGTLMLTAITSGCSKKNVDYNVDNNVVSQTDEAGKADTSNTSAQIEDGGLRSKYEIPLTCDTAIDTGDTGLSGIQVKDDEIEVPDTSSLQVVQYKKKDPEGNEVKKQIAENLFDKDEGIYAYDSMNRIKKDIQAEIEQYKVEKENYPDPIFADSYDMWISDLETELENAPENYPAAGDYSSDDFVGTVDGKGYELYYKSFSRYRSFNMREDLMIYRPKEKAAHVMYYSKDDYTRETKQDSDQGNIVENACTYTEEEAQLRAEDFLSKIGAKDVALQSSSDLYWVYTDTSNTVVATDIDGYTFTYVRSVDKQPSSTMSFNRVENLQDKVEYYDMPIERYEITMDSNGIINANWCDYLEATGESEQTEILSFPELLEKANETIPAYYKQYPCKYNAINFNDVTLTYYLTAGEKDGEFAYKPVWIFFACDDDSDPDYPSEMVVLDATDGSVIDMLDTAKKLSATSVGD